MKAQNRDRSLRENSVGLPFRSVILLQLKGVGPKLVPFFKAVLVYFIVLPGSSDRPSWTGVLVKVLPVLSLVLFVLLHEGASLGLGDECVGSTPVT